MLFLRSQRKRAWIGFLFHAESIGEIGIGECGREPIETNTFRRKNACNHQTNATSCRRWPTCTAPLSTIFCTSRYVYRRLLFRTTQCRICLHKWLRSSLPCWPTSWKRGNLCTIFGITWPTGTLATFCIAKKNRTCLEKPDSKRQLPKPKIDLQRDKTVPPSTSRLGLGAAWAVHRLEPTRRHTRRAPTLYYPYA